MTIQPGDPNGIAEHNALTERVAQVASQFGVVVDLPPVAVLGQSGHVDAHNKLRTAIEKIAAEAGIQWAVVSGGTVTEYIHPTYGLMEVHTFNGNGSLVCSAGGQAEVLVVGAGANANGSYYGNGGDVRDGMRTLPAGTHAIVVGAAADGSGSQLGAVLKSAYSGIGFGLGFVQGAGSTSGGDVTGYTSSITGTPLEYGRAAQTTAIANRGYGGYNAPGSSGVVIVAVKKP